MQEMSYPANTSARAYSFVSAGDQVQLIHRSEKVSGYARWVGFLCAAGYSDITSDGIRSNRDETYSLADGVIEKNEWELAAPLNVVTPAAPGNAPLEAPTTALSTNTKVDPTAIEAPGSSTPATTPSSQITAPGKDQPAVSTKDLPATSSAPTFSSGANLNAKYIQVKS
jgi:hypothetical protein